MRPRLVSSLSNGLLGRPGRQSLLVLGLLKSAGLYLALAAMLLLQARLGLAERLPAQALAGLCLLAWGLFYALVRSGFSERWSDPGLRGPQLVFGLLAVVAAYAISGSARGAQTSLLVMLMVFGLFELPAAASRWGAALALLLLGMVMGWKVHADPQRYPASVELLHFACVAVSLAVVSALVSRMAVLRLRLARQKADLKLAQEQIRVLATQDELTSLPNRRHMTELMLTEKARQQRNGRVLSVAMIDIDHFKRINDTYGHTGGDLVLKTFSQFSRASLRPSDTLARWGGEEFLLLLPDTSGEDAMLCVERMRIHFARMSADAISPGLHVTFSAGVSACRASDSLEDAVERADQAMHRAKAQGSNCSVLG